MTHLHCLGLGAGAAQVVVHVVLEAGPQKVNPSTLNPKPKPQGRGRLRAG